MNNIEELEQAKFLSVSALNRYLAYRFDRDENLSEVYLEGEISNFKVSGNNLYFSIKDSFSEISALMFYSNARTLQFKPEDGMLVQVVGKVSIYEKRGTYSITVRQMIIKGVGLLYQQYLDLKKKLQEEGLFDEKYKKPLPLYPKTIGVITSATGEAINDILSTLNKRYPLVKVVLYPALVQGSDAPKDLVRALNLAYLNKELDCLIIGRGGGSFEDLACFNDEELARKLFESPIPTISAVGHEGDYTIVDFIASTRAATPTAAAMKAVRDQNDIYQDIEFLEQNIKSYFRTYLSKKEQTLDRLDKSYALASFPQIINNYELRFEKLVHNLRQFSPVVQVKARIDKLNGLNERLHLSLNNSIIMYEKNIQQYNKNLQLFMNRIYDNRLNLYQNINQKVVILNPLNLMDKGYSIVIQDDKIISSVKDINKNKKLIIQMKDGIVNTNTESIEEKEYGK